MERRSLMSLRTRWMATATGLVSPRMLVSSRTRSMGSTGSRTQPTQEHSKSPSSMTLRVTKLGATQGPSPERCSRAQPRQQQRLLVRRPLVVCLSYLVSGVLVRQTSSATLQIRENPSSRTACCGCSLLLSSPGCLSRLTIEHWPR